MICYPNAKINLGLYITSRRPDGYHNLSTLFYPIPLADKLDIKQSYNLSLACQGSPVEGENIILKVYRTVAERYNIPPVEVNLHKIIPMGAGLGGGSADAAFMLKALNQIFSLGMGIEEMEALLTPIGADCPFFVKNVAQYAEGIGNVFTPCTLRLDNWHIVIVKPNAFVSTREAYAGVCPQQPPMPIQDIIDSGIEHWRDILHNDFEDSIFPMHPEIKAIKDALYNLGATYASMSGSGAALFGLFRECPDITMFQHLPFAQVYKL